MSTEDDGTESWQAVGTPIDLQQFSDDGLNVGDIDGAGGESVSISGDGTVVAIGYPGTSQNGASVRVFELVRITKIGYNEDLHYVTQMILIQTHPVASERPYHYQVMVIR